MKKLIILCGIGLLVGCSSGINGPKSLYYWGNYNDVVYAYYNETGNFSEQEQALLEIISNAEKANQQVAPGVYGFLGLVQLKQGKSIEAQQAFSQESKLYPESSVFMQFVQGKRQAEIVK
ncbi:DUF4810 domain-containing protein [Volucribacter psittacicida]|nr:DUF4810 domain-containing protein [Volucribacter psittacicida]